LSLTEWLLFSLAGFLSVYVIVALILGRAFVLGRPREMSEYVQIESSALVLAGFALTALTVLVSVYSNSLSRVQDMMIFFSISFVLLLMVSLLTHFRTRNLYGVLCHALRFAGILAIGDGFLVFFYAEMPSALLLVWIYVAFLIAFSMITLFDLYHYYLRWKESRR